MGWDEGMGQLKRWCPWKNVASITFPNVRKFCVAISSWAFSSFQFLHCVHRLISKSIGTDDKLAETSGKRVWNIIIAKRLRRRVLTIISSWVRQSRDAFHPRLSFSPRGQGLCLEIPRELPAPPPLYAIPTRPFSSSRALRRTEARPPLFSYRPRHSCSLFVAYHSCFLRITPHSRGTLTLAAEGIVGRNEQRPANWY